MGVIDLVMGCGKLDLGVCAAKIAIERVGIVGFYPRLL